MFGVVFRVGRMSLEESYTCEMVKFYCRSLAFTVPSMGIMSNLSHNKEEPSAAMQIKQVACHIAWPLSLSFFQFNPIDSNF